VRAPDPPPPLVDLLLAEESEQRLLRMVESGRLLAS